MRDHIGDLWFPLVRVPVLSITDRVDVGGSFQRGCILEQHAPFGAQSGADHDRRRRGNAARGK